MNIFVTDSCPIQSAKFLDNTRVVKMVLESAQLLSTALRLKGVTEVYKVCHLNHPSSRWTRATLGNYLWVLEHFKALCDEFERRFGKVHKSKELLPVFEANKHLINNGELQPFSNNARNLSKGVDYSHIEDVTMAYRLYLSKRWEMDAREPVWS